MLHDVWQLTTDLKGRGGFISMLHDNDSLWSLENATISFQFAAAAHKDTALMSGEYLLSVEYLASYTHVGVVDIYICGHFMTTIDALWSDRISIPQIRNIVFDMALCEKVIADKLVPNVEIKHRIQHSSNTISTSKMGI